MRELGGFSTSWVTWKAIFVHTVRETTGGAADGMSLPDNPDIGEPTVYH